MGDFEDVFGAGADAADIIDGYSESYRRSSYAERANWFRTATQEEIQSAQHWDSDEAWARKMKSKGYEEGPRFSTYAEALNWEASNKRPFIRRPTYDGYIVFFT